MLLPQVAKELMKKKIHFFCLQQPPETARVVSLIFYCAFDCDYGCFDFMISCSHYLFTFVPQYSFTAEHDFGRVETELSFSASNIFKLDRLHAVITIKDHDPVNWSYEQYMDMMRTTLVWYVFLFVVFVPSFHLMLFCILSFEKISHIILA